MFLIRSTTFRVALTIVALVASVSSGIADTADPDPGADSTAGLERGWYARVVTTAGSFLIRLLPDQAPQSVAHFTALAEGRLEWIDPFTGLPKTEPYYDGLEIHKVRASQRFEFGDPTATGRGAAPFYVPEEVDGPVDFSVGWRVGMTRARLGRISGSLLFVTSAAQPFLNRRHPCFGIVVDGKEVVQAITVVRADHGGRPLEPIRVRQVRVFAVGQPDPLPEPKRYSPPHKEIELNPALQEPSGDDG